MENIFFPTGIRVREEKGKYKLLVYRSHEMRW